MFSDLSSNTDLLQTYIVYDTNVPICFFYTGHEAMQFFKSICDKKIDKCLFDYNNLINHLLSNVNINDPLLLQSFENLDPCKYIDLELHEFSTNHYGMCIDSNVYRYDYQNNSIVFKKRSNVVSNVNNLNNTVNSMHKFRILPQCVPVSCDIKNIPILKNGSNQPVFKNSSNQPELKNGSNQPLSNSCSNVHQSNNFSNVFGSKNCSNVIVPETQPHRTNVSENLNYKNQSMINEIVKLTELLAKAKDTDNNKIYELENIYNGLHDDVSDVSIELENNIDANITNEFVDPDYCSDSSSCLDLNKEHSDILSYHSNLVNHSKNSNSNSNHNSNCTFANHSSVANSSVANHSSVANQSSVPNQLLSSKRSYKNHELRNRRSNECNKNEFIREVYDQHGSEKDEYDLGKYQQNDSKKRKFKKIECYDPEPPLDLESDLVSVSDSLSVSESESKSEAEPEPELKNEPDDSLYSDYSDVSNTSEQNNTVLQSLMDVRDTIKKDINLEEKMINKANERLNEEMYIKRCDDQNKRIEERRIKENISIFMSDKDTYLKMKSKILKGVLKEINITPLFLNKYHIIKFMEINTLCSMESNNNIDKEYKLFQQLQKVSDGYDFLKDSNDSDSEQNPMDDIDEDYLLICEIFLKVLSEIDYQIISDKQFHTLLNKNPNIKEAFFPEPTNQQIFVKDIDKDEYK